MGRTCGDDAERLISTSKYAYLGVLFLLLNSSFKGDISEIDTDVCPADWIGETRDMSLMTGSDDCECDTSIIGTSIDYP